jgi:hypothetical protein
MRCCKNPFKRKSALLSIQILIRGGVGVSLHQLYIRKKIGELSNNCCIARHSILSIDRISRSIDIVQHK